MALLLRLLLLLVASAHAVDLGISFNETLSGFFTNGDLAYQDAYDQGKAANRWFQATSHVTMEHMQAFVADPQHAAVLSGKILIRGLTGIFGSNFDNGILNLFNGTVVDHQMQMHYYIPFLGLDGQPYHAEGVKHVKGDNCSHFFYMMTTLFTHVRRGHTRNQGTIVSTGIIQIDFAQVVELVGSFRLIGNGTDADKLDTISEFSTLLLKDVAADCFNTSNWQSQFWYIWASNGHNGFLLDLIARPDTLELRLETYVSGSAPTVTKQYLSIDDLTASNSSVAFGSQMRLNMTSCVGAVQGQQVNVNFVLRDMNDFVPKAVWLAFKGLVPQIESYYGATTTATVAGVSYPATAIARTTYPFQVGLEWLQWAMISALAFDDSDLRVELIGARLANNSYVATSYVFLRGKSFHLNDPLTSGTHITTAGALLDGSRVFAAHITAAKEIDLTIKCTAPESAFAELDEEGETTIHTTVLGNCTAAEAVSGAQFATASALLELKTKAWTR